MLCNCHSLYAMAQWGREHLELARTLGFTRGRLPVSPPYIWYSVAWIKVPLRRP
jgi:hypothetical protein